MEITIEAAVPADAGEILTVQRAAYVSEAQLYDDPRLPPLTETLAEVSAALAGDTVVLVARVGPRLAGVVRARLDGATARIGRLAVAPDLQGRGIGGRLLATVEARLVGRADRLELFTGAHSTANLRLYGRHGYRVSGHRRLDTGPGLTYLEKRLAADR